MTHCSSLILITVECMERSGVVLALDEQKVRWYCLGAYFSLKQRGTALCPIHWLQSHNHVMSNSTAMMVTTRGYTLILILVECMERCRAGIGRTGRTLVSIVGVCLNLKVWLLGVRWSRRCLMWCPTPPQWRWHMVYGSALILIEYNMEPCRTGFGRAESTWMNIMGGCSLS